ncbi:MAG: flippase [Actinomycetota bacterium]|nr:flippase [Actinomycetota bacterium]
MSDPATTGARRATSDVAIQLGGRLANLALGVVVTLLIVRALGDRGFGQWTTIFAVTQVATAFGDLGLETVAVARAAGDRPSEPRWLGALVSVRTILAVPVTAASAVVVVLLASNYDMRLAGIVISLTLLLAVASSLRAVFQLRVRNDITTAVTTLNSVLWAGAVVAVVATDGGIVELAAGFTGVWFVTIGLQAVIALRMGSIHLRDLGPLRRELLRVGLPVSVAGLLVTAYVRIDQVLVFDIAGAREAGLYGAVYRILDQAQFVPIAVMTTLFPMMAAAYPADLPRVRELTQQAGEYLLMVSLPALAFAIVAGTPTITLLFGDDFAAAGPALPILLGAFVVIALGHLVGSLRIVLGLQRRFVAYAALGLVVNLALNFALIPAYGFLAAAWITVGTEILVLGLMGMAVTRELRFRPAAGRLARIIGAATVLGLALWGLQLLGAGLAVLVPAAVLAYPVLLFALRALTVEQIRTLRQRPAA